MERFKRFTSLRSSKSLKDTHKKDPIKETSLPEEEVIYASKETKENTGEANNDQQKPTSLFSDVTNERNPNTGCKCGADIVLTSPANDEIVGKGVEQNQGDTVMQRFKRMTILRSSKTRNKEDSTKETPVPEEDDIPHLSKETKEETRESNDNQKKPTPLLNDVKTLCPNTEGKCDDEMVFTPPTDDEIVGEGIKQNQGHKMMQRFKRMTTLRSSKTIKDQNKKDFTKEATCPEEKEMHTTKQTKEDTYAVSQVSITDPQASTSSLHDRNTQVPNNDCDCDDDQKMVSLKEDKILSDERGHTCNRGETRMQQFKRMTKLRSSKTLTDQSKRDSTKDLSVPVGGGIPASKETNENTFETSHRTSSDLQSSKLVSYDGDNLNIINDRNCSDSSEVLSSMDDGISETERDQKHGESFVKRFQRATNIRLSKTFGDLKKRDTKKEPPLSAKDDANVSNEESHKDLPRSTCDPQTSVRLPSGVSTRNTTEESKCYENDEELTQTVENSKDINRVDNVESTPSVKVNAPEIEREQNDEKPIIKRFIRMASFRSSKSFKDRNNKDSVVNSPIQENGDVHDSKDETRDDLLRSISDTQASSRVLGNDGTSAPRKESICEADKALTSTQKDDVPEKVRENREQGGSIIQRFTRAASFRSSKTFKDRNNKDSSKRPPIPEKDEDHASHEEIHAVIPKSTSDPQASMYFGGGATHVSKGKYCGNPVITSYASEFLVLEREQNDMIGASGGGEEASQDMSIEREASELSFGLDTDEPGAGDDQNLKELCKSHYVDKNKRKKCHGCQKPFNLKRRSFHCRRCGEVFCRKCVQYRRKLNILLQPDPEGVVRKVCLACYEDSSQEFGSFRKQTEDFMKSRLDARNARIVNERMQALTTTFWRDQLDIRHECMRLVRGFQDNGMHDGTALQDVRSAITTKTPQWQKSPYWKIEKKSDVCRKCKAPKRTKKASGICRVCGISLCKCCCNKDLLVYYPDSDTSPIEALLVIINTEQCPEKEPRVFVRLYVCDECRTYISAQQDISAIWYKGHVGNGVTSSLFNVDADIRTLCETLDSKLSQVNERMEAYSEGKQRSTTEKQRQERELEGLHSTFDAYEARMRIVRQLKKSAETSAQKRLLDNYCRSKHRFFLEHRVMYRKIKNRM